MYIFIYIFQKYKGLNDCFLNFRKLRDLGTFEEVKNIPLQIPILALLQNMFGGKHA